MLQRFLDDLLQIKRNISVIRHKYYRTFARVILAICAVIIRWKIFGHALTLKVKQCSVFRLLHTFNVYLLTLTSMFHRLPLTTMLGRILLLTFNDTRKTSVVELLCHSTNALDILQFWIAICLSLEILGEIGSRVRLQVYRYDVHTAEGVDYV